MGTARIGQYVEAEQDSQDRRGRTGQAGQDRQNRRGRTEETQQERHHRTGRTGETEQNIQKQDRFQDRQNRIGGTGPAELDIINENCKFFLQITFLFVCKTLKLHKIQHFYGFTRIAMIFSRKAILVKHRILAKKCETRLTVNPNPNNTSWCCNGI
jgi:hypothetical protein